MVTKEQLLQGKNFRLFADHEQTYKWLAPWPGRRNYFSLMAKYHYSSMHKEIGIAHIADFNDDSLCYIVASADTYLPFDIIYKDLIPHDHDTYRN